MARSIQVVGAIFLAAAVAAAAQTSTQGVVIDQTGLPLPGALVQLQIEGVPGPSTFTRDDGTFVLPGGVPGALVVVSLEGFETTTVAVEQASRIVLPLARATETTTVVAPAFVQDSPTTSQLGSQLTAETLARLPSAHLKAKDSLPLVPSVVRGNDGLLRIGGARPYETPLLLDGFDVTDPTTGISNINLPFEAVHGIEVLRDPMAISYGGLLGGVMQLASKPGDDDFKFGIQGFVPRPRFQSPGFGRLEGIFPRVFASGNIARGRIRYLGAVEYDYERIPVPDVTSRNGRDVIEESATAFGRTDLQVSARQLLTIESVAFPAVTKFAGLSPRRDDVATSDNRAVDVFAGLTDRFVLSGNDVLTVKIGVLEHRLRMTPNGGGPSYLSPAGWRGNWFSAIDRTAARYSTMATLDHNVAGAYGTHTLSIGGSIAARRVSGVVTGNPVVVEDSAGRTVRTVQFDGASRIRARDMPIALWTRDVWKFSERLEIDLGVRADHNTYVRRTAPSARGGVRYVLDSAGLTVLKAGVGRFVGSIPLAIEAFGAHPIRVDRSIDPASGKTVDTRELRPAVANLQLPHALATTVQVERHVTATLDAQVGVTLRQSRHMATLHVPNESGTMPVESTGRAAYRELQVSVRQLWKGDQQLFVSYVRSSSRGELNDFAALFQSAADVPLVRSDGMSRTPTDARNRLIAWSTVSFPHRIVISPVVEMRSGFPYSVLDERYRYFGEPNAREFPAFVALDAVAYKTFTVRKRSADIGLQLFNATNHFNPRDVYAVTKAPQFGDFTNSVGTIVRGFMLIKW